MLLFNVLNIVIFVGSQQTETERVSALETEVEDLEAQLSEQEEEATNVIAMWQEKKQRTS